MRGVPQAGYELDGQRLDASGRSLLQSRRRDGIEASRQLGRLPDDDELVVPPLARRSAGGLRAQHELHVVATVGALALRGRPLRSANLARKSVVYERHAMDMKGEVVASCRP